MCYKFSSHQHARLIDIAHTCCPQTGQIAKNVSMMQTTKEVITVANIQSLEHKNRAHFDCSLLDVIQLRSSKYLILCIAVQFNLLCLSANVDIV